MIANILSIAGSDPSGGAGIQADIKAISANGGYAMAAITALTAQNTQGVTDVQLIDPKMIAKQIASIRADIRIDAIKIGMLGDVAITQTVLAALDGLNVPIILDPVMVAKSGDRLLDLSAVTALRDTLLPRAAIVTPNLPEAADLLGCSEAIDQAEMKAQARSLLALGPRAVLLKGGHLPGDQSPDLLMTAQETIWLDGPRFQSTATHGTGCTLSSALATFMGQNMPMAKAAEQAKAYVVGAIARAADLSVGQGQGPTHHFHALWPALTHAT